MHTRVTLVAFAALFTIASGTGDEFDSTNYDAKDIITRDVAVIGGGSSGTYGAVNLHVMGKSVILIEKEDELGGHVNTYTDPSTGETTNYGVQTFWNTTTTWNYFKLLGISGETYSIPSLTSAFYDFATGQPVAVRLSTNFTSYASQLYNYPYLEYGWDLPSPVPDDLVLPFAEFVTKYDIPSAYTIYFYSQGLTSFLQQITINVFKMFDSTLLAGLAGGDVVPPNNNNKIIFEKASAILGSSNILLSSKIIAAKRPLKGSEVLLVAKTPLGNKLIKAAKLLISIPPLLDYMQPYDLSEAEISLFSQWTYSSYYTMLVNQTGLPSGYRFMNANSSSSTWNIPELPAPYQITESNISGLFYVWYGSPTPLTQSEIESDVKAVIGRLQAAVSNSTSCPSPLFVEFRSHTPFKLEVSKEALKGRFYDHLKSLQGHRNTWYTGAAFISQASGVLWNYTHSLLPDIVAE
ncbi:hypothetical protein N7448_004226 [Penicillium atrosanguineum]|uniref:Uncharacterized protein n=1 Tax=Penicillium atrosanguineum TaxID=1132637 RepID=A0A9W9L6R4_9EURO|nr:uncharacterized protein N7443_003191 [Penicillium atrosanguineum]KAJ5140818.1 hypothetical protein N7448_004226 [Penicillium atrosanguineum]KAJ5310730.1 hypothetical protein N7443_003191 [Penicillium atrosanguineum]KAJ5316253.1 hypothetical protein N7476_006560 [Penicillium atrosanguineum]